MITSLKMINITTFMQTNSFQRALVLNYVLVQAKGLPVYSAVRYTVDTHVKGVKLIYGCRKCNV